MLFGYFTLLVALIIETVGAYYSITGLAAIFSGAVIPILIMGASLEVGKVTAAVWLKMYWERASITYKLYLVPAVAFLMVLTSMGIFGFLSKAHSDQSLVSGDSMAKVAIYDEKIKTARENIEADRRQLRQMDEAVDQVMGRSTDEKGADKANAIRRSQQRERSALARDIEAQQKIIIQLNEEAAPLRAENRKIEADVGPIKYIAALIYGDNPDANILERAVRWVIILIVAVFDPLALVLILAAQQTLKWNREDQENQPTPKLETETIIEETEQPAKHPLRRFDWPAPGSLNWPFPRNEERSRSEEEKEDPEKAAIRAWKQANPNTTIKSQRQLYEEGRIDKLPWEDAAQAIGLEADNEPPQGKMRGFGNQWPDDAVKGDMFLRIDRLPSALYKYNGKNWIEIDKNLSDQYSYDHAYIDHLITKLDQGEYDPELLTDAELEQIQHRVATRES